MRPELLDDDTQTTQQFALPIACWCHVQPIVHACFGLVDDYAELLLPLNILAEDGFLKRLNHTESLTDADLRSPELIGWLYQFHIAERKDEVMGRKYTADEETLNRLFIDLYGLQDELTPDVPWYEVTILQAGEISIANDD